MNMSDTNVVRRRPVYNSILSSAGGNIFVREGSYLENREVLLKSLFRKTYFVIEVPYMDELLLPQRLLINVYPDLEAEIIKFHAAPDMVRLISPEDTIHKYILVKTKNVRSHAALMEQLEHLLQDEKIDGDSVYADKLRGDSLDTLPSVLNKHFKTVWYYSGMDKKNIFFHKREKRFRIDFTPTELLDYMKHRIKGQDRAIEQGIMFVMEYLNAASNGGEIRNQALTWFLTAPSGMGKTEFFRALRDFLNEHNIPVPVIQIDLSQITETGYKGNNVDFITDMILEQKGLTDGTAICFLDEADKKFMPSYNSKGGDTNELVQNNLLTVIEGTVLESRDGEKMIDTNKTMFVLMGAFQSIRSKKRHEAKQYERLCKADHSQNSQKALYTDITLEDMIETGMLEEIAGRITSVVNMDMIPKNIMRELLTEKADDIASEFGITIEITEAGMEALLDISYTNMGVRTPVSRIRSEVVRLLSTVYFSETYNSMAVTIVFNGHDDVTLKQSDSSDKELSDRNPEEYHNQISYF